MLKNKLDFKLVNIALLVFIVFLVYQTSTLWLGVVSLLIKVSLPFLISFALAYALYPFSRYLQKLKIPNNISAIIAIFIVVLVFGITLFMAAPLLFDQLGSLFNSIIVFIKEISLEYDVSFGPLQNTLSESFDEIIKVLGKYISNGAISFISVSFNYLSMTIIVLAMTIYLLLDMESIRNKVKLYLKRKKKIYHYVYSLDLAMRAYLTGFMKIVLITLFEYSLAFLIIGHPNAILLGFLAAISSLIPYFGGMFTNIIAAITAFVISPSLFLRTIILFLILSILDSYIINPFVYGKTNEVHPLIVILSVFIGGKLWGILGIIISLPLAILIITTYKYFKGDIKDKLKKTKTSI